MKNKKLAWMAVAGWMLLIFVLSHQPGSVSSGLSSGITDFLLITASELFGISSAGIEEFHTLMRKNAHFIAYFILGALLVNALGNWKSLNGRVFLNSFVIAVLYAVSDEIHQLFIEGRSGELRDVMIDGAGAAAGIFISWLLGLICSRRKSSSMAIQENK